MKTVTGLPGASGLALFPAEVLSRRAFRPQQHNIDDTEQEILRFQAVRKQYAEDLGQLYQKNLEKSGEDVAGILHAYAEIAQDDSFFRKAERKVQAEKVNADWALLQVKETVCEKFLAMEDPYLKERADDISNVCDEIIRRMNGTTGSFELTGNSTVILVAEDLTPEDTIRIDKACLGGIITELGGVTSHTVILAKALGIPAVVGAKGILEEVRSGTLCCLNGETGEVLIDPDEISQTKFLAEREKKSLEQKKWAEALQYPAVTKDGHAVKVCINSGDSDSLQHFSCDICDGIGLFRTEFLFMNQTEYPTEDVQYEHYRAAAERAQGKEVIIRTLDIGGDKQLDYMDLPQEANPFLGFRAIRLCLDRQELFLTQLRAILRASAYGALKIMFPMIVTLEELETAKVLVKTAMKQLDERGLAYDHHIPVGIMVETPAAALLSDVLAQECDFFSIGTNDLIQYTTATDRQNERVQYLYDPFNLSVLRAIQMTIRNGHAAGIPVGMCGEAASNKLLLPLLLAMGLDEFSVAPAHVGQVKYFVQNTSMKDISLLDSALREQRHINEVKALLERSADWK